MTIATMSPGTRATLSNILARGLASLPARQRTPGTVAAVEQLQAELRRLSAAETSSNQILARLALRPGGLVVGALHTLQQVEELAGLGLIQPTGRGNAYRITRAGWEQLWVCGLAQELISATSLLLHAELSSLEWV